MEKTKKNIFLAGDSTMQAYSNEKRPQFGWGELLYKYIDSNLIKEYHRENCKFEQQKCFSINDFIIDNCAMAGRSLKSFTDEERHIDLFNNARIDDFLIIQFGHNDISKDKPERYVPIDKLSYYFNIFIELAKEKGITPIILSPILIDIYSNDTENLKDMVKDLKKYIIEIENIAKINNVKFINVGEIAKKVLNNDLKKITDFYLQDHVHLNKKGGEFYAEIIFSEIKPLLF